MKKTDKLGTKWQGDQGLGGREGVEKVENRSMKKLYL